MPRLQQYFRPEFINRLDDIVMFNPISRTVLLDIVDIQLGVYQTMIDKEKGIRLKFTEEAKEFLAKKGRDPIFGARPLKRALQRYVLDPLAMKIIDGEIESGERLEVGIDPEKDHLHFASKKI